MTLLRNNPDVNELPLKGGRPATPRPAGGYKLLAVDLDGTLLAANGEPHAVDLAAMAALAKRGVLVTIATGRLPSGTLWVAEKAGICGPLVCGDGSVVVDAKTGEVLAHRTVEDPAAVARALSRRTANTPPLRAVLFTGDTIVHDEAAVPLLPFFRTWSTKFEATDRLLDHPALAERAPSRLTAVVGVGTFEDVREFENDVLADGGAANVQIACFTLTKLEGLWGFILRAAGPNKGTGLRDLGLARGISLDEMVAVGDWLNDIPMLSVVGRGVAMGQAPSEVVAVATDRVSQTGADGGGIKAAIERLFGEECDE